MIDENGARPENRRADSLIHADGSNQRRQPHGWRHLAFLGVLVAAVSTWQIGEAVKKTFSKVSSRPKSLRASLPAEEPARAADRNLDPRRETKTHERWGTVAVGWALLVGVCAGVAFLFAYWNFGSNWILGGLLALFLGAMGVALILNAHWLMLDEQATEPREVLESPPGERDAAILEFRAGAHQIRRRGMLTAIGLSAGGIATAIVVSIFRSLGSPPDPSLYSTIWKRGQRLTTSDGKPVSVDTLQPGSTLIVFPDDRIGAERAQTVLIRVRANRLQMPASRSSWAPQGYVAYSRVCTHAGCVVGLYEATTELLMCPCHQSTFDILNGARPTGGPAVRSLPQLPLYVDGDGFLCAAGGFSEPPGPGFWSIPS